MNNQIWEREEKILLVDLYYELIKISASKEETVNQIKNLSNLLRKRASVLGYDVIDTFRNFTDLRVKMANIQFVDTKGKMGLSDVSISDKDIVNEYKANPEKIHAEAVKIRKKYEQELDKNTVESKHSIDERPLFTELKKLSSKIETDVDQEFVLNFNIMEDISFTRPVRFVFCNEIYNDFTNWRQLYTSFLELLYQTNQNAILGLCGKNIYGNGRVEITDTVQKNILVAPKSFAGDLYVETNLSARDIVRKIHRLLEICGFSVGDLKIYYKKKYL